MKHFDVILRLVLIVCGLLFAARSTRKITGGFTVAAISSNRAYHPEFEISPLSESETRQLDLALNQPYSFYGWGGQAYVFFSADGNYVIKFFKQRRYKKSDFLSYKLSFQELKKETALLYCHLNQTSHLNRRLEIIDALKIHHFLPLDHLDFIVQRRAEPVSARIKRAVDTAEITETFSQILKLIDSYLKKGVYNRDPFIPHNCGLLDDRAILIDVGSLKKTEQINTAAEYQRITASFEEWLERYYPQYLAPFQEELQEAIQK